ncbi:hypothetical protein K3495_g5000 [Podosphaera aphanis]|nr:hypothetical protein K3495_g5000 [Podosphaera aphanis]
MFIGATAIATFSGYLFYIATDLYRQKSEPVPQRASAQADVSSRYDTIASSFDTTVDSTEYWLGLRSLRQQMIAQAHGNVLEVSVGTGRNLEYYDWDVPGYHGVGRPDARGRIKKGRVQSLTAVDQSLEMLTVAHDKLDVLLPRANVNVRWVLGDAAAADVIPASPCASLQRGTPDDKAKYDTVVQTMGLCSVSDPVALLRNLGHHVKDDGKILLLEHGRGRWNWLNRLLDHTAEAHAREFGCWWNRDLAEIVAASGLEVVQMTTPKWWHGGTTWWIELARPKAPSGGAR